MDLKSYDTKELYSCVFHVSNIQPSFVRQFPFYDHKQREYVLHHIEQTLLQSLKTTSAQLSFGTNKQKFDSLKKMQGILVSSATPGQQLNVPAQLTRTFV